jgi:hypothetical protein
MSLTIPQMLRKSADMLEQNCDGMKALLAVEHTLQEVQLALYRARPGLEIDRLIGTKEKVYG